MTASVRLQHGSNCDDDGEGRVDETLSVYSYDLFLEKRTKLVE